MGLAPQPTGRSCCCNAAYRTPDAAAAAPDTAADTDTALGDTSPPALPRRTLLSVRGVDFRGDAAGTPPDAASNGTVVVALHLGLDSTREQVLLQVAHATITAVSSGVDVSVADDGEGSVGGGVVAGSTPRSFDACVHAASSWANPALSPSTATAAGSRMFVVLDGVVFRDVDSTQAVGVGGAPYATAGTGAGAPAALSTRGRHVLSCVRDTLFERCSAVNGGAEHHVASGVVHEGTVWRDCTATELGGGVLLFGAAALVTVDGVAHNCSAGVGGGWLAARAVGPSEASLSTLSAAGCTAGVFGGAVYGLAVDTVNIVSSTFAANVAATGTGGAVALRRYTRLLVQDSSFTDCSITRQFFLIII